ncbi:MAG: diguanylate cyclase [Rhodocyclaceae bacterium]
MSIDLFVEEFMQSDLLECSPSLPVGEAAVLMRNARCGSILVVDQGAPVGIWTETDALAGRWFSVEDLDQPVSVFMSSPVKTIPVRTTLGEAARQFRVSGVRHFLVNDAEGRYLGMISQTDVVRNQGVAFFLRARDVASVVTGVPSCVDVHASFHEVRQLMHERSLSAVVVRDGERLGIITPRDVIGVLGTRQLDRSAGAVASFPLLSIAGSASLFQARDLFAQQRIRHLGVTDDNGALVGLLSLGDILDSVEHEYVRDLLVQLEQQAERLQTTQRESVRQANLTEAILNALPISVFVKDGEGRVIVSNEMSNQIIGRPAGEIIGRTDSELFAPEIVESLAQEEARVRSTRQTLISEQPLNDGRTLLLHKRAVEVDGSSLLIGAAMDVTEWKRADALMVSSHHVLELIVGGAESPAVLDALCQRMESHLAGAWCSILLLDADGVHLRHGAGPSLPAEYMRAIDGLAIGPAAGSCGTAAFTGEQVIVEDVARSPLWTDFANLAGRFGLRSCWSTPFFSAGRKVLGTFAVYHQKPRHPDSNDLMVISHGARLASVAVERWQQIEELKRLATIDMLTGLNNRGHFIEGAEAELRRADRFDRDLTVLMLDIDFFKRINDGYGHAAGDEALRVFSRILKRETREIDLLGRLGGEEFAVLLPETSPGDGMQVAERIRAAIEQSSFSFQGSVPIIFTVSLGASFLQAGDRLDNLLARADEALYRAKHGGRNRVEKG